jgi:hypothetical protein
LNDVFNKSDIDLIKELENSIKTGYSNGRWYPYRSLEGGTDTIGYGHKLISDEMQDGLSNKDAELLLIDDLSKAMYKVLSNWKGKELTREYIKLLTILEFNTKGSVSPIRWPKLANAMYSNNKQDIRREILTSYRINAGYNN